MRISPPMNFLKSLKQATNNRIFQIIACSKSGRLIIILKVAGFKIKKVKTENSVLTFFYSDLSICNYL